MDAGADHPPWLSRAERIALAAFALLALAGWLAVDVLPTYDSLSSLLWGNEIIHGHLPTFSAPDAPTEHPLWVVASTILALFGHDGARLMTLSSTAMFVVLVAGVYVLGRDVFGWPAGAIAAAVLMTRLDFDFYAAFAYVDAAYLAALIWAAVLEHRTPRRGGPVWALLIAAGLLRPEAWLFCVVYGIWMGWPPTTTARERVRLAALAVAAPVLWGLLDLAVTGDPVFSLTYTHTAAHALHRNRSLIHIPGATVNVFDELLKYPVVIAALLGLGVALWEFRGRLDHLRVPLALLVLGLASFEAVLVAGVSQVSRYGAVTAVALVLFVGALVARLARRPAPGAARTVWWVTLAVVVGAVGWEIPHLHPRQAARELRFRAAVEHDLRRVLRTPAFRRGRACGPVIVPSHKLVPLVQFLLDARRSDVFSRTEEHGARAYEGAPRGVALIERTSRLTHDPAYGPAVSQPREPPRLTEAPPPNYRWAGRTRYFAVFTRC